MRAPSGSCSTARLSSASGQVQGGGGAFPSCVNSPGPTADPTRRTPASRASPALGPGRSSRAHKATLVVGPEAGELREARSDAAWGPGGEGQRGVLKLGAAVTPEGECPRMWGVRGPSGEIWGFSKAPGGSPVCLERCVPPFLQCLAHTGGETHAPSQGLI